MTNNKKSSTTKKTTSKKKNTKRKSTVKKGKVYIAPYKIIVLCAVIIIVCMILLLATTVATNSPSKNQKSTITERFENKSAAKNPEETKNLKAPFENAKKQESGEKKQTAAPDTKKSPAKDIEKNESKQIKKQDEKPKVEKTEVKSDSKPVVKSEPEKKELVSTKTQPKQEKTTSEPVSKASSSQQKQQPSQTDVQTKGTGSIVEPPITPSADKNKKTETTPVKSKFNFPEAKNGAQLIFVFDDGGQNLKHLEKFFDLPFPFTVAVLPKLQYSAESAARIRKSGNEVILHQPMQSVNKNVNPGPGAIKPEMTEDQIKTLLFQNINEIAPIVGLNNHEGSEITADAEKMAVVMQFSAEQGLYFLDSRTNVETKVPYVAKEMGYSYYERNIFLDNEKTRENTLKELNKGLALANKNGSVIMIGHIWSADYLPSLLIEAYPELKEKGYTFSVVSKSKAKK